MGSPFDRWKSKNKKKRCGFIVPKTMWQEQHRCPFVANADKFCKRHAYIYRRTGSKIGELPKPASFWEEKYRKALEELVLLKAENFNLCKQLAEK